VAEIKVMSTDDKKESAHKEADVAISAEPLEESGKKDPEQKAVPSEKMTKAQLLERVEELQKSSEENFDRYVRSQAEMENMKKRFLREKEDLAKFSNETLVKQLLTVIDNLEQAIAHSGGENSFDALREGVELTLKGLLDTLSKTGLEPVDSAGQPFDPNFHEAVSEMEDDSVEPGTVIEELQKGYVLNQRLVRPARVVISRNRK
jgi:molecular chaperone GrpE